MARTKEGVLKQSPHSRADMAKRAARKQGAKVVVPRVKIPRKKVLPTKAPRRATALEPKNARPRDTRTPTSRKTTPADHAAAQRTVDDLRSIENLHEILGNIILQLER
jgi:hypothetical protein